MSPDEVIIPPVQRLLNSLYERFAGAEAGDVATYIPELAKADPRWFGIVIVTLDGYVYSAGDCDLPFTLQSISKPFVYGLALEEHGWEYVLDHVGLEPSGDVFNAISLDPGTGRPSNPMINAGAIATTSLIKGDGDEPMARILDTFGRYIGHEVDIDEAIYKSESATGHRNRAISHMLRNFEIVLDDPESGLDLYFKQCSIAATCRDIAVMGATLANRGVNPITGERAIDATYVDSVLSIMSSCGMYNYAGEWIYRVGIPAKSGVSGGLLACLPGQLGIGVFSPRLDPRGNSTRGVLVCDELSRAYSLHMHNTPNVARAAVRARYNVIEVRSKRQRRGREMDILAKHGDRVRVYELQGHLNFASVEALSRDVFEQARDADFFTIDFKRTLRMDDGGIALCRDMLHGLLDTGKQITLADAEHVIGLDLVVTKLAAADPNLVLADNLDRAIEWCEDELIASVDPQAMSDEAVPLEQNEFFHGLDAGTINRIKDVAHPASAAAGTVIMHAGEDGDRLYLLVRGEVSVTVDLPYQEHVRLATYSAGMAFGQEAVLGNTVSEADYITDTEADYYELAAADLESIAESDPRLMATVYRNLSHDLARQLSTAAHEIRALST